MNSPITRPPIDPPSPSASEIAGVKVSVTNHDKYNKYALHNVPDPRPKIRREKNWHRLDMAKAPNKRNTPKKCVE